MFGMDDPTVLWTAVAALAGVAGVVVAIRHGNKKDPARLETNKVEGPVVQDSELNKSPVTGTVKGTQHIGDVYEGDGHKQFKHVYEDVLAKTEELTIIKGIVLQKDQQIEQSEQRIQELEADVKRSIEEKPNADVHWKKAEERFAERDFDGYQEELDSSMADQLATVAQTFFLKAMGYEAALKYPEALKAYDHAHRLQPQEPRYLNALGYFLNEMAMHNEAIHCLELALPLLSASETYQQLEGTVMSNLGTAWKAKGGYDRAIEYFGQALAIDRKVFGEEHSNVATRLNNIGSAWDSKGEYDRAIGYFEQALAIVRKVFGEEHPYVAATLNNLGKVWASKGEYDRASGYYGQALAIFRELFGEEHPYVAVTLNNLALAWESKGEYDRAIGFYEQALDIDRKVFGEEHPKVATRLNNIGGAQLLKDDHDIAFGYFEQALEIVRKVFGEEHRYVASTLSNLGGAWDSKGEYDKAIGYYEQALNIDRKVFGEEHPDTAIDLGNLGAAYFAKAEYTTAIPYFEKALAIFIRFVGEGHPHTKGVRKSLESARKRASAS